MSQWAHVKLQSIKADRRYSLVGGPFGSELTTRDYVEEGVPVIRGSNLPDDQLFRDEDFVFVSEDKADQLSANLAYPGDVVFTQRGTLGQVGVIPSEAQYKRYLLSQSQMKLTVDLGKTNAKFVYYYFRHPNTIQSIKNHALTSGVPHINLGILREFEIPLPPDAIQQKIIDILSAYDDLIENNKRRMALLEASARLLYEEWFVRLRFPGHEQVPVVDGMPKGWARKTLGEYLTLNYGKALKADERVDGPFPVYGSSGIIGHHENALVKGPGIIVGRKGNVGSVFWCSKDFYPIDTVYFINAAVSTLYLFYALKYVHFISTDVAVPGLNRDFAYSRSILLPPTNILHSFLEVLTFTYNQLEKLEEANQKLKTARDLLLPQLMSGEITL